MSRAATIAAFVLYLGTLLGVGFWTRRRARGFDDFVTGGGAIPAWMLALSFMANFISSNSFVGHSSKSYEVGLIWCVVGGMMVLACVVSWHLFAPRFAAFARTHAAATLPDFFEHRFGSRRLAVGVNWVVIIATLFYVLAVLRGTALVVASALGLSYEAALMLLYAVTLCYCMLGGLWADVSTDVVQAVLLAAGALALLVAVVTAAPLPGASAPEIRPAPLGLVLSVGLGGALKLLVDPKQVIVFYAFRDEAAARRFRWFGPLMLLVVYACLFPLGYLARGLVTPPADVEGLVPALVFERQVAGQWFGVLFLISLLAASMSSLDSALLVMASCFEKHVVAPALGDAPSARRTRLALAGLATLALLLSLKQPGGIIALTTFAGALAGAALLPSIVLGFGSRRVPAAVVGASIGCGVLGAVLAKGAPALFGTRSPWLQDVFGGIVAATLVLVAGLWLTARAELKSIDTAGSK